ncbi:alpha/beta fold hydrolase [Maritalea sp.]|uniref:alpha/beta fold hydrolase n=1 Tax=Maritalea sp. TaxID=2003361 RepID=UPI003EFA9B4A
MKTLVIAALVGVLISATVWSYTPDLAAAELEAKYVNEHSQFAEIDGLRMHYQVRGDGPTIVLLHGSNASLQTWDGWAQALQTDHRVIAIDLPGHGLTGPDEKMRYDWPEMAILVARLLDHLQVETYTIAGNSMGGAVAWNLALLDNQRAERLVLVDSRGYPADEPKPLIFQAFGTWGVGHILSKITPRIVVDANLRDLYGDPDQVEDATVTQYQDMLVREGNRYATYVRFSQPSNDVLLPLLKKLRVPTLIMWGEKDNWILPKYGALFARDIKGAKLMTYPDLGHVPMEEAPERTVADLRAFLQNS